MKRPSTTGSVRLGPALKKSRHRRAHDRLHPRKRVESAAASVSPLGAAWPNSRAAVPLQLEDHFRCRRHDRLELLLPDLRKGGRQGRDDSLPDSPPEVHQNAVIGGLGQAASTPKPTGGSVPGFLGRPNRDRIPPALCAGTQPRRIPMGSLEAAYVTQRVSQGFVATQRRRAPNSEPTPAD